MNSSDILILNGTLLTMDSGILSKNQYFFFHDQFSPEKQVF